MDGFAPLHLAAAIVLANAPWLPARWQIMARIGSWSVAYALWMIVPLLALRHGGSAGMPPWELWPVTLALFAVLAFPAIVWRYLRR